MFFKSFGLYGQQKCELIMAAVLRVLYSMFNLDGSAKVKKQVINADGSDSEYMPEEMVLRAKLPTLVCSLDF